MPFWSLRSRAERVIETVPAYAGFEPVEIPLADWRSRWLPDLAAKGARIGLNWSGTRATGYDIGSGGQDEDMSDPELNPLVRLLDELEQPFDPDRHYDFAPDELVRFALTASDYWADKALDWLTFGCPIRPVEGELRHLASDRARPQALRHRTLRLLKHHS